MSLTTDLPEPQNLAYLPEARLLVGVLLLSLLPIGIGAGLLLAQPDSGILLSRAWTGAVVLAFSLVLLAAAVLDQRRRQRARLLFEVPLPAAPGIWMPEALPLSAHGRLVLAQAAPIPPHWAIGHDGRHAYVVEWSLDGGWRRLARRRR
jgi:hypothetical protein